MIKEILRARKKLEKRAGQARLHGYAEQLFRLANLPPEPILETYNEMCRAEKYLGEIYLLGEAFAKLEAKNLEYLRSYLDSSVTTGS